MTLLTILTVLTHSALIVDTLDIVDNVESIDIIDIVDTTIIIMDSEVIFQSEKYHSICQSFINMDLRDASVSKKFCFGIYRKYQFILHFTIYFA